MSIDQVCGTAVRNPQIVAASPDYGLTIASCVPANPQSKGGSEATVKIAKADIVPTDHNLRSAYESFTELEFARESFCDRVNMREHRLTRRPPAAMLIEERERLHPLPAVAHTLCFGHTRRVSWQSTISVGGAIYSVPSTLKDMRVWARVQGSELVVVHADSPQGPREVARHALTTPVARRSQTSTIRPDRRARCSASPRPARARSRRSSPSDHAPSGGSCVPPRRAPARAAQGGRSGRLAKLHLGEEAEQALLTCAQAQRFAEGDLAAILAHQQAGKVIPFGARASEEQTLQRSTRSWERLGR